MPNIPLVAELNSCAPQFQRLLAQANNALTAGDAAVSFITNPKELAAIAPAQDPAELFSHADTRVFVRCRPVLKEFDGANQHPTVYSLDGKRDALFLSPKISVSKECSLEPCAIAVDGTFDSDHANKHVYVSTCASLVELALEGGSTSLIAYGQTGSGKTHTTAGVLDEMADRIDAALKKTITLTAEQQMQCYKEKMRREAAAKAKDKSCVGRATAATASKASAAAAQSSSSSSAAAAAGAANGAGNNSRGVSPSSCTRVSGAVARGVSPSSRASGGGGVSRGVSPSTNASKGGVSRGVSPSTRASTNSNNNNKKVVATGGNANNNNEKENSAATTQQETPTFETINVPALIIEITFIELTSAGAKDLMTGTSVQVCEDAEQTLQLLGATALPVRSAPEFHALVAKARAARATAPTERNAASSRSHMVARLTVKRADSPFAQPGVMCIADLAGSESTSDAANHDKSLIADAKFINTTLMTLKDCIRNRTAASVSTKHVHIPYRRSPLTLLLRDSFELVVKRPTKTAFIACVSPLLTDARHTHGTLRYANLLYSNPTNATVLAANPNDPHTWNRTQALQWLTSIVQKNGFKADAGADKANGGFDPTLILPDGGDGRAMAQIPEAEFVQRMMAATGFGEKRATQLYQALWKLVIDARTKMRRDVETEKEKKLAANRRGRDGGAPQQNADGAQLLQRMERGF